MKIVNIVLSALILVLALVCTVFSFFLFQKRTEMVKGWETMAASISTASTNLGRPVAKEALDFKTADPNQMTATTNTLVSESKKVFDQRNGLAADLQVVAKTVRMKEDEVPAADQLFAESGNSGKEDVDSQEAKGPRLIVNKVADTVKALDAEKKTTTRLKSNVAKIATAAGVKGVKSKRDNELTTASINIIRKDKEDLKDTREKLARTQRELRDEQAAKARVIRERDSYKARMEDA